MTPRKDTDNAKGPKPKNLGLDLGYLRAPPTCEMPKYAGFRAEGGLGLRFSATSSMTRVTRGCKAHFLRWKPRNANYVAGFRT